VNALVGTGAEEATVERSVPRRRRAHPLVENYLGLPEGQRGR
jgi:hypothetical protein